MKILVTGSNGCVGAALKSQCINEKNWVLIERKDCDLINREQTIELFKAIKPDYIVHLAAYVPGFYNINRVSSFSDNVRINENVLEASNLVNIERGIFSLSINMFSEDISKFPIDESMIFEGGLTTGPFAGYAYAKRMLALQCLNYNNQYNRKYVGIIPCNIYGPNDNIKSGRLIPNLILKFKDAIENNTDVIINGTGKPLRQFIYSIDLAKIIKYLVNNYYDVKPIICSDDISTEVSIADLVVKIAKAMNFNNRIKFDSSKSDGLYKKTVNNSYLKEIINFPLTSLEIGLKETLEII